jgi:hypothetical protein
MTPAELHAAEPGLTRAAIAKRLGLSLAQVQRALRGAPRVPGGGRPRLADARSEVVSIRLTPAELALVDAAREHRPRAEWVRERALRGLPKPRPAPSCAACGDSGWVDDEPFPFNRDPCDCAAGARRRQAGPSPLRVACPACDAPAGKACRGPRPGTHVGPHDERRELAVAEPCVAAPVRPAPKCAACADTGVLDEDGGLSYDPCSCPVGDAGRAERARIRAAGGTPRAHGGGE